MTVSLTRPRHEEYIDAAEEAFAHCPEVRNLSLVSVQARAGMLTAHFEGRRGDFRGPFGIAVRLSQDAFERQPSERVARDSVREWVHRNLVTRASEAYQASMGHQRGYTPDGVWWLVRERTVPRGARSANAASLN